MTASTLLLILVLGAEPAKAGMSPAKQAALAAVEEQAPQIAANAKQIWNFAELAFQEHQSSKLLADTLESEGFSVKRGVATMKTAFVAEFGEGKPVIAILAEYDALPGLSQEAVPHPQTAPRRDAGHGCGHNLFGAASTAAAIACKRAMEQHKLAGTIRLYGCPAEEGGGGKVYLARDGQFKDVDAALHWHPSSRNSANMQSSLAVIRFRARFTGKSAHAAGAPDKGRSALDGVELMNIGVNYLREHISSQARIHYVITRGGRRPNVVPDDAEGWYYIRAPKMTQAQEIFTRVKNIAKGAALMSETEHELAMITGTYELLVNEPLAAAMDANLRLIGPPAFSPEDRAFAAEIRKSLGIVDSQDVREKIHGPVDQTIAPFGTESLSMGSTDVGDVSWNVPTAGLNVATAAREIPGHSWAFVACSGSPMGDRGAVIAAKTLAATAMDVLQQPELLTKAKADFERRRSGVDYQWVLGDEPAPEKLEDN